MFRKYRFCVWWQPTFLPDPPTISQALCYFILFLAPWDSRLTEGEKTIYSHYWRWANPGIWGRLRASPGSQQILKKQSLPDTLSDSLWESWGRVNRVLVWAFPLEVDTQIQHFRHVSFMTLPSILLNPTQIQTFVSSCSNYCIGLV